MLHEEEPVAHALSCISPPGAQTARPCIAESAFSSMVFMQTLSRGPAASCLSRCTITLYTTSGARIRRVQEPSARCMSRASVRTLFSTAGLEVHTKSSQHAAKLSIACSSRISTRRFTALSGYEPTLDRLAGPAWRGSWGMGLHGQMPGRVHGRHAAK